MKKKIIIFISLVLVIAVCSLIGTTLSRYRAQASIQADGDVARWIIKVNNSEVSKTTIKTFSVTPVIIPDENVLEGTSAPGSMSYADIEVDVSQVDVSFQMDLEAYIPGKTHTHPTFQYINLDSVNEANINSFLFIKGVSIGNPSGSDISPYYTSNASNEAYFNTMSYFVLNQNSPQFNTYRFLHDSTVPLDGYDHSRDLNTRNASSTGHILIRLYFEGLFEDNTRDTQAGHDASLGTNVNDKVYVALVLRQWIHS